MSLFLGRLAFSLESDGCRDQHFGERLRRNPEPSRQDGSLPDPFQQVCARQRRRSSQHRPPLRQDQTVDRGGAALHQGVEPDRLPQIGHDSRAERSLLGAGGAEDGGRREG